MTDVMLSAPGLPGRRPTAIDRVQARSSSAVPTLNTRGLEASLQNTSASLGQLNAGLAAAASVTQGAAQSIVQAFAPLASLGAQITGLAGPITALGGGVTSLSNAVGGLQRTIRELIDSPLTMRDRTRFEGTTSVSGSFSVPMGGYRGAAGSLAGAATDSSASGSAAGSRRTFSPAPTRRMAEPLKLPTMIDDVLSAAGMLKIPGASQLENAKKAFEVTDRILTGMANWKLRGDVAAEQRFAAPIQRTVREAPRMSDPQLRDTIATWRKQWAEVETERTVLELTHGDAIRHAKATGQRTGYIGQLEWQAQSLAYRSQTLGVGVNSLQGVIAGRHPLQEITVQGRRGGSPEEQPGGPGGSAPGYRGPTTGTGRFSAAVTQTFRPVRPREQTAFEDLWARGDSLLRDLGTMGPGDPQAGMAMREIMSLTQAVDRFAATRPLGDEYGSRARALSDRLGEARLPVELEVVSAQQPALGTLTSIRPTPPASPLAPTVTPSGGIAGWLQGAMGSVRGFLPGKAGDEKGKGFAGVAGKMAGDTLGPLVGALGPLGIVATLLGGVFQGLAPLIEAVKEPLRIVGQLIGAGFAPILRAIFPIFKLVAMAATWVGQIFFTVAGGIAKVVGSLIKGLGKLIDKIPGMSDMGLGKAGQAVIDLGKGFDQSAKDMAKGREELKKLEFGETAQTVEQANEALRNVPEGFKVAVARFQAASPMAAAAAGIVAASVPAPVAPPEPVVENRTVTIESVQIVSNNPEQIWRELQPVMERESYRHDGSILA